jgi:hypothetical protein
MHMTVTSTITVFLSLARSAGSIQAAAKLDDLEQLFVRLILWQGIVRNIIL